MAFCTNDYCACPYDYCSCKYKCECKKNQLKAEKIFTTLHRMVYEVKNSSPQFSRELITWLNNTVDSLQNFDQIWKCWEKEGSLDLDCRECQYTKNPKNNDPGFGVRDNVQDNLCLEFIGMTDLNPVGGEDLDSLNLKIDETIIM